MFSNALALFLLLPLTTAHFLLDYPASRGFDDDKAPDFPCGGFDSVKTPRSPWPQTGGPIQLDMHHTQTNVAVYLSVGDNPGGNFSIVLRPQLSMEGLGNFCLGMVSVPAGLNISDGTPATIQVVSNGDPDGGLYQCADVTLTSAALSAQDYSSNCKNGTGIKVTAENIAGNPNQTTSGTPSASASGSAASVKSTGLAAQATAASWIMGAVGVAGLALL